MVHTFDRHQGKQILLHIHVISLVMSVLLWVCLARYNYLTFTAYNALSAEIFNTKAVASDICSLSNI